MSSFTTPTSTAPSSDDASKMTFAERMMAKTGHKEGKGLGKDGEGIVSPIEGNLKLGREGLGFEGRTLLIRPKGGNHKPNTTTATVKYDFKSTIIHIGDLPIMSEPSYVYSLVEGEEVVVEIYTPSKNHAGTAWVEFKTPDQALAAVSAYDRYHLGPNGRKISVGLTPKEHGPAAKENMLRYTDFLRERNTTPATATVFVSNLPNSGPISNIKEMVERIGMDEVDYEDDKLHGIKNIHSIPYEGVLVHFECIEDAKLFRSSLNGDYWKNNTLHVDFRPDSEMDEFLGSHKPSTKPSMKLFMRNTRGLTNSDIVSALHPVVLNDVQVNPGGFTFIFLAAEDAVTLLDKYPSGVKVRGGRKIYLAPPGKKDKKDLAALNAARARMGATSPV